MEKVVALLTFVVGQFQSGEIAYVLTVDGVACFAWVCCGPNTTDPRIFIREYSYNPVSQDGFSGCRFHLVAFGAHPCKRIILSPLSHCNTATVAQPEAALCQSRGKWATLKISPPMSNPLVDIHEELKLMTGLGAFEYIEAGGATMASPLATQ